MIELTLLKDLSIMIKKEYSKPSLDMNYYIMVKLNKQEIYSMLTPSRSKVRNMVRQLIRLCKTTNIKINKNTVISWCRDD